MQALYVQGSAKFLRNKKISKKNILKMEISPHFWNKSAHALDARPSLIYITKIIVGGSQFFYSKISLFKNIAKTKFTANISVPMVLAMPFFVESFFVH